MTGQEKVLDGECRQFGDVCRKLKQSVDEIDAELVRKIEELRKLAANRDAIAAEYDIAVADMEDAEDRLEAVRRAQRRSRRKLGPKPSMERPTVTVEEEDMKALRKIFDKRSPDAEVASGVALLTDEIPPES